jgi:aspartate ammonia-lyase
LKYRTEKDTLGNIKIPFDAYFGAQTRRAAENFPVSELKLHPVFVESYVLIKTAAALANAELGVLDKKIAKAIIKASNEILRGRLREYFVVDVYQAGAGTSFNMNTNEVIANRAIEILGGKKGDYNIVNPNDHVNMAQSTNDTFPSAMKISSLLMLKQLLPVIKKFEKTLRKKTIEFISVIKSGRTHLQDASPITLGQEFSGYAENIRKHYELIYYTQRNLSELGLGGTAVGTGLNAHINYSSLAVKKLSLLTGLKLKTAGNYFEAMQSMQPFTELSSALRNLALDLTRITNDIRLLASGPATGLGEIILPAVQPGSSIMPGKVNPSMAEMLSMVCFQVMGNDLTVTLASQAGQLELNVMMPVIAYNVLWSMDILKNGLREFDKRCVSGIKADKKRCRDYAERSISIVTVLNPIIGYSKAADIAKIAVKTGKSIIEVVKEKDILSEKEIKKIFNLKKLTYPGLQQQQRSK